MINYDFISPAGSDYTPVTTDLTFNNTNAAIPQTVAIPILDDLLLEDSEVFNVTLTTNNSNITFLPELTTVTIQDVESKLKEEINHRVVAHGYTHLFKEFASLVRLCDHSNLHFLLLLFVLVVIGFNQRTYSVREDAGSVTVSVSVMNGTISQDVIITLSTTPGGSATGIYVDLPHS